jgi:cytochrome c-type biogenesis protein CcmH/NrfG
MSSLGPRTCGSRERAHIARAALQIDPGNAEAHFALGVVLASLPGRAQEALAQFETVLRIKPDHEAARQWIDRLRAAQP